MVLKTGIDVSKWQGEINWNLAKRDIDFAILRAGYGQNNIDEQFIRNADECTRLNIPFGVYWFSYAYNEDRARREAKYCIEAVKPYKLDYPIAFDFEYDSVDFSAKQGVTINKKLASAITRAFCEEIRAAGYTPIVYANPDYLARYFDDNIPKEYDIWLAKWPKNPHIEIQPDGASIWQYSNSGAISGINGRVDMNVCYKDYAGIQEDDDNMTIDRFSELMDEYRAKLQQEDGSSWSKDARDWAINTGLIEGSDTGYNWKDFLTREQFATVMQRYDNMR